MDGTQWAASAMIAARSRLDIATHNLANVSTGGFQRIVARGVLTPSGVKIERTRSEDRGALPTGAIGEMIDVLSAQRSFESAEKVVSAIDRVREKSSGDVARVK